MAVALNEPSESEMKEFLEDSSESIISPTNKSRYGRIHKPKVNNDFITFNMLDIKKTSKYERKSKSPGNKLKFNLKQSTANTLTQTKEVRKFFKTPTQGSKIQNMTKLYISKTQQQKLDDLNNFDNKSFNDVHDTVDVTEVLKIISTKKDQLVEMKNSFKTNLKTYANKRKNWSKNEIVESFGLPDEPIMPISNKLIKPKRISNLDITNSNDKNLLLMSCDYDVNLKKNYCDFLSPEKNLNDVLLINPFLIKKEQFDIEEEPYENLRNPEEIDEGETNFSVFNECLNNHILNVEVPKENGNLIVENNEKLIVNESSNFKINRRSSNRRNKDNSNSFNLQLKEVKKELIEDEEEQEKHYSLRSSLIISDSQVEAADPNLNDLDFDITKVKTENIRNSFDSSSVQLEPIYSDGDLAWAKLSSHPFWPCLITVDPVTNELIRPVGKHKMAQQYHVRFFGDRGRRSWLRSNSIMPFYSKDDLKNIKDNLKLQNKKNNQIMQACTVKQHNLRNWQRGVEEAESLLNKTVEERLNFFKNLSSSPIKDLSPIHQIKKRTKLVPNPFKKDTKTNVPDVLDVSTRLRSWRKKKPATLVPEIAQTKEKNDVESTDVYNSENSFSEIESKSPIRQSTESQEDLYRKNNIFKKVPKEKVCQVCKKGSNVFKCKGLCGGFYHIKCVAEQAEISQIEPLTKESLNQVQIIDLKRKSSKIGTVKITSDPIFDSLDLVDKIDVKMKEIMDTCEDSTMYADSTTDYLSSEESLSSSPIKKMQIAHVTADDVVFTEKTLIGREINTNVEKNNDFRCPNCISGIEPPCLVCDKIVSKTDSSIRQKCSLYRCGRFYHPECLKLWPQTQWSLISTTRYKGTDKFLDTFMCPSHVCHTCVSDDPRARITRTTSDKVARCLECPATYHATNYCIPAGTVILSTSQIICPRHLGQTKTRRSISLRTINTTWCFICSEGGDLICCETCPTSVHNECTTINFTEDDTFICDDCESGRFPLYDEIVWVKLGAYRWWPALTMFPNDISEKIKKHPHEEGEFVVKFFGTNDYHWVTRGRVFLFQEGDKGHSNSNKKRVDKNFLRAVKEASEAHKLKKEFKSAKTAHIKNGLKPPPYIRIKVNKPVGNVRIFDANVSNTTSCECDPNSLNPCGPDSDCLNRLLMTECDPQVCPAGEKCHNQQFEKRQYPPLVPYKTDSRGWGLKCLENISKGQFVIEYVGEMIEELEYQRRIKKMHEQKDDNYYFLTIDKDRMLDAGPKGNMARFMNHSCQPNCETQKWTVNGDTRVGLFAVEDIPADVELTFNYNLECIGKEKKVCMCKAPNCSGFIGVKAKQDEISKKLKKSKKKKPAPTVLVAPAPNLDPCFICGETGEVAACQNKICNKFYHLKCVNLEAWPEGRWVCPWHSCKVCTKRTIRCCVKCIKSYCPTHSEGNIRHDRLLGFICNSHDPRKEHEIETENKIQNRSNGAIIEMTNETDVTSTTNDEELHLMVSDLKQTKIDTEEPVNRKRKRNPTNKKFNAPKKRVKRTNTSRKNKKVASATKTQAILSSRNYKKHLRIATRLSEIGNSAGEQK